MNNLDRAVGVLNLPFIARLVNIESDADFLARCLAPRSKRNLKHHLRVRRDRRNVAVLVDMAGKRAGVKYFAVIRDRHNNAETSPPVHRKQHIL